jgi:hypothetical protein
MLRQWSVARMRAELGALEASAERAGIALACVYSSSDELMAAEIDARRAALAWPSGTVVALRIAIVVTACAAVLALGALAVGAI